MQFFLIIQAFCFVMRLDTSILVYVEQVSPRLQYVLQVLLQQLLGLPYTITSNKAELTQWNGPCIQYGACVDESKGIFIPSCGLLYENGIRVFEVTVAQEDGLPVLFALNNSKKDLRFDLFAMTFFLISRYEEYWPFKADQFGRFPGTESIAYKNGFLQRPVINEWAKHLGAILKKKYPEIVLSPYPFRQLFSCDVDLAWAYLKRPLWRSLAAFARDVIGGRWRVVRERLLVALQIKPDPFFEAFTSFANIPQQQIYFFLLGDRGVYDKNIAHTNPAFRQLIRRLFSVYTTGIHPSFGAHQIGDAQIKKEIERLQAISGAKVSHSRQHFLLLTFPGTYRRLIRAGIEHDYSMGYADQIGFRAGIATPYRWYDLLMEETTALYIHPFQAMDVTLKDYLGLAPADAIAQCIQMQNSVSDVGGEFCLLWHNSSFSALWGWEGWEDVPFIIMNVGKAPKVR